MDRMLPSLRMIGLLFFCFLLVEMDDPRMLFFYLIILLFCEKTVDRHWMFLVMSLAFCVFFIGFFTQHFGVTPLIQFRGGNAWTLESLLRALSNGLHTAVYGIGFWVAVESVDAEFIDYWTARGGKIARLFRSLFRGIQRSAGRYRQRRKYRHLLFQQRRFRSGIGYAIEEAIGTAWRMTDRLRARGYGLGRRSVFSRHAWKDREWQCCIVIVGLGVMCLVGWCKGIFSVAFDPVICFPALTLRLFCGAVLPRILLLFYLCWVFSASRRSR